MWQWYFFSHMKSQADWDVCYGRRPSTTVWSSSSKVSVSYFPTTCTSSSLRLAYLTWIWMHLLGSIHTLLNPHTRERYCIFPHRQEVFPSSLHLSRPPPGRERCKMEIKHLTGCLKKAFKIGCFRFHNLASL